MLRKILCFLGFHKCKRVQIYDGVEDIKVSECVYCGHWPYWR